MLQGTGGSARPLGRKIRAGLVVGIALCRHRRLASVYWCASVKFLVSSAFVPVQKGPSLVQSSLSAMKLVALASLLVSASAVSLRSEQDPCAGCNTGLAQAYQQCARDHGDPCSERNAAGIVSSAPGTKKDIGCCMKKEKHDRCMTCKSMDCQFKTCNVNKNYYSKYSKVESAKGETKEAYAKWDKEKMKAAGWSK